MLTRYIIPIFTEVDVFAFDFTTAVFLDGKKVYSKGTGLLINNPYQRMQWSRSSVPWTTPSQTPRRQVRRGNWWQGSSSSRAPGKEWVSFQSFYFNPKTLFLGDLRNLHLILQGAHSAFHKAKPSLTAE